MSLGVLTNVANIYAQNNLNQTQGSLQKTLTQLSSGSRLNSGADDAAGLAVADGLHANVAALTQSAQNASDGIGRLQTADGGLAQVTNLLNRAVTLATEAANGTLNGNQISAANQEYQKILSEVGNIGSTTNFNGNTVFTNSASSIFVSDGTVSGAHTFSDAVGALSAGEIGITAPGVTTTAAVAVPTASGAAAAAPDVATFGTAVPVGGSIGGTLNIAYASGAPVNLNVTSGSTLASAVTQLNTQFTSAGIGVTASAGTGANLGKLILTGTNGAANTIDLTGSALSITSAPTTTESAGVDFTASTISQLTSASAQTVLTSVTSAIADVAYQRGKIGSTINELTAASSVASTESVNLTSAESSIRSTNFAQATSDLAKYQVLSQTGISAISQANSVQQEVLKLLQ